MTEDAVRLDLSGSSIVDNGAAKNVKIKVGDGSLVESTLADGAQIEVGANSRVVVSSDDTFVRAGKGADIFNYGFNNKYELMGMFKKFNSVGTGIEIRYPNEEAAYKRRAQAKG